MRLLLGECARGTEDWAFWQKPKIRILGFAGKRKTAFYMLPLRLSVVEPYCRSRKKMVSGKAGKGGKQVGLG